MKFNRPMKTGLILDKCFVEHETGHHPERPERLHSIERALEASHLLTDCPKVDFQEAPLESICRVHDRGMVERVLLTSAKGGGYLDIDTYISSASARVALNAAGAGLAAAQAVIENRFGHVMCLVRPPGHHASGVQSMGFCLFNNIAIAAEAMLEYEAIEKVAILDIDVHHGNGTQDIFYSRGDVFYFSIHEFPHYPGTGAASETGRGEGLGKTLNLPLPGGISRETWFSNFQKGLDAVAQFEPDAILVSAGFDAHRLDPLGDFPLDEDAYFRVADMIAKVAKDRRLVSMLEGGYNTEVLGRSVAAYLQGFH